MIIFYSWQKDLPNNTNWTFIETALKKVVKTIRNDDSIQVEPVIDRDTLGIAGSPEIPSTILAKIDRCDAFVCDLSIINKGSKFKLMPNPNVLFELGYALRRFNESGIGNWNNIIMVMNTAFGELNKLPFDLDKRRVVVYSCSENEEDKASERKILEGKLESQIRSIIENTEFREENKVKEVSIFEQTIEAIENAKPNRTILVKKYLKWLIEEIDKTNEIYVDGEKREDSIIEAINASEYVVFDFARLSETIALVKDFDVAKMVYDNFAEILDRYNFRENNGSFRDIDFDYYKFIGHEVFVMFISFFVKTSNWDFISKLLSNNIYIQNNYNRQPESVQFGYISQDAKFFRLRNTNLKLNLIHPHSTAINNQISNSRINEIVPMSQLTETDLFLFLYSRFNTPEKTYYHNWYMQSFVYLRHSPKFLLETYKRQKAIELMQLFNIDDIETFRQKVNEAIQIIRNSSFSLHFLYGFNVNSIGTQ